MTYFHFLSYVRYCDVNFQLQFEKAGIYFLAETAYGGIRVYRMVVSIGYLYNQQWLPQFTKKNGRRQTDIHYHIFV